MVKTLIIPGFGGSNEGHWQRLWLIDHPEARLVEQRSWSRPSLAEWLFVVEGELARNPGALLVGHSLGAVLVAKLAGRPSARHVAGALLVAPCDFDLVDRYHPGAIDFGDLPEESLPFPATTVASRNDPYLSYEHAQRLSLQWGTDFVDLGSAGHINIASGFGRWPRGYELASQLLHRSAVGNARVAAGRRPPMTRAEI